MLPCGITATRHSHTSTNYGPHTQRVVQLQTHCRVAPVTRDFQRVFMADQFGKLTTQHSPGPGCDRRTFGCWPHRCLQDQEAVRQANACHGSKLQCNGYRVGNSNAINTTIPPNVRHQVVSSGNKQRKPPLLCDKERQRQEHTHLLYLTSCRR